jgi:Leucine-rich repeat (LRR) protein
MKRSGFRTISALITVFGFIPSVSGQDRVDVVEIPGGGRLFYFHADDSTYNVNGLRYSGSPDWLINQNDERSHWHTLQSLTEIELTHTTVTQAEVEYIARLKTVRVLDATDCVFHRDALFPLQRMNWLRSLSLEFASHGSSRFADKASVDSDFFTFLRGLPELESLTLSTTVSEETLKYILKLEQLRWLSLGGVTDLSTGTASAFASLQQLENLLIYSIEDPTPLLNGLKHHQKLAQLSLVSAELSDQDLESIVAIGPLEIINFRVSKIGSLSPFKDLDSLIELHINSGEYAECDGCRFLENLPNLVNLNLTGSEVPDFSIGYLRGHKHIRVLVINAELDLDAISILESMPNLEYLVTRNLEDSKWRSTAMDRLPNVQIDTLHASDAVPTEVDTDSAKPAMKCSRP